MKLEQVGNCVKINDTLIPAVNIQVKDVPGYIYHEDGSHAWYGVYFEILFENASLWVVWQGFEEGDVLGGVVVVEHPRWGMLQSLDFPGVSVTLANWEEFLDLYNEKKSQPSIRGC